MTSEERLEYVNYRINSAFNTYNAAKVLADNGFWNSAVNRLYYAVYYSVNALLVHNDIYAHSHSGMRAQFSMHFVKTGKIDRKYGVLLAELYDLRQKGDYDNIYDFDPESVKPMFESVLEMISQIRNELQSRAK